MLLELEAYFSDRPFLPCKVFVDLVGLLLNSSYEFLFFLHVLCHNHLLNLIQRYVVIFINEIVNFPFRPLEDIGVDQLFHGTGFGLLSLERIQCGGVLDRL